MDNFKTKLKPVFQAEYHCLGGCSAKSNLKEKNDDDSSESSFESESKSGSEPESEANDDVKEILGVDQWLKKNSVHKVFKKLGKYPNKIKIHVSTFLIYLSVFLSISG